MKKNGIIVLSVTLLITLVTVLSIFPSPRRERENNTRALGNEVHTAQSTPDANTETGSRMDGNIGSESPRGTKMSAISSSHVQKTTFTPSDFGAVPDDNKDDRAALQRCINEAAGIGGVCQLSPGTYMVNGDLWLKSNLKLQGTQQKSILKFNSGILRIIKNNSTKFYYTSNYNNEIVPNQQLTTLKLSARKGSQVLQLKDASFIQPGQLIYIDNNKKDTWAILENSKLKIQWNNPSFELARKELLKVSSRKGNTVTVTTPLHFSYKANSSIGVQKGEKNISISDLGIENQHADYAVIFERPRFVEFSNVSIKGKGGILLTHFAYHCKIKNCNIKSSKNRAILIENFSAFNTVTGNTVEYVTGGDAAIMVMMSSYNNVFSGNKVTGLGKASSNEGGIFIHALCYNNEVYKNTINNTAEGIGAYFGAFDNKLYDNTINNVKVGIISFYARNNSFNSNHILIKTARNGNQVGALLFSSNNTELVENSIKGNILMGIQLQASNNNVVRGNRIQGPSTDKYSFGIRLIPGKVNEKTSNAALSRDISLGNNIINDNQISQVKTTFADH